MRTIFTLFILINTPIAFAQEPEHEIKSRIKHVTVFLEGAQVTRQSQVMPRQGVSILKFTNISPSIQEQSIQVEANSPAVKILSVSFRTNYLKTSRKPETLAALEAERAKLMTMLTQENAIVDVYREEESILKTNKAIGGSTTGVDVAELKIAMDYFRQRLTEIKQQLLQSDRNIRKHNEALAAIDAQLRELNNRKDKPTGEIYVKVSAKNETPVLLTVKYLVKDARWFPSYDIRAIDIASPVSITYKASVSQQSGEDWENVMLTISSGNPSAGGARPLMRPWYIGFNNHVMKPHEEIASVVGGRISSVSGNNMTYGRVVSAEDGSGLPGVNVVIKGTTVGSVTDVNGYYSLPLTSDAGTIVFSFVGMTTQEVPVAGRSLIDVSMKSDVTQLSEVVVSAYGMSSDGGKSYGYNAPRVKKIIAATQVARQTNIEFDLDEPFSVKSDGELRTTEMVAYEIEALYEYYCVPKLDRDAFLTAKLLNWDVYNFLDGEASLFFEGKYIGKSIMDTRNTSDTLTLSLGRDANVVVTREKVKDLSSRQVIGSNQKVNFAYDIVVRNKKGQPITIWIEDQIPVPNTKEIDVNKMEDSKAEYNPENGLLKWKKTIAAGKVENIALKYVVRYPKHSNIILE